MKKDLVISGKVPKKNKKKVLLINPRRKDVFFILPHSGLATLAAILKKRGHEVFVLDCAFAFGNNDVDTKKFIDEFKPDIIGASVYTPNFFEADELISEISSNYPKTPLLVGGPHATVYTEELINDKRIDYIFPGEAELTIIDVVENAKKQKKPKIIKTDDVVNLDSLPIPDYKCFYKWEIMTNYPLLTSRGCPFRCSFCAVSGISCLWRPRDIETCIKELEKAQKEISPNLKFIIYDDNPTVDKPRFKKFLRMYAKRINAELSIINTRADGIDDELLTLLKACKVKSISLGVEHAHPEVFKLTNKGETLQQIIDAAKLVKKYKIALGVSFVVGLPKDNFERTKYSIRFCKRIKPDDFSVNIMTPYRHTDARRWFEEHGAKLESEIGYKFREQSLSIRINPPIVETPDFSKKDREKAYYMFLFRTIHNDLRMSNLKEIISIAGEYDLYSDFFYWLPRGILKSLKEQFRTYGRGLAIYKRYGLIYFIKRYKIYNKYMKLAKKASPC